MNIIVTGGAGFIGSALIRFLINNTEHRVANVDALTYAGNISSLSTVSKSPRYIFYKKDISNIDDVRSVFNDFQPDMVMHLAAESHVDRSIENPWAFVQTNMMGTAVLLEVGRQYWEGLSADKKNGFKFHHVSTDEVYGDLETEEEYFTELTPYKPSSPYSASKAGSDHLVRAWWRTYGFPVVITNCSNNYGPFHFPEKMIPHMILNAVSGKPLPVYGDGAQIRDWLYVEDHVRALWLVASKGVLGETYNIGGHNEKKNIEVIYKICEILEELVPNKPDGVKKYDELITFVVDRPGHDKRYAIDADKIGKELGWSPEESFDSGLSKTVKWYLDNEDWWQDILNGNYCLTRMG